MSRVYVPSKTSPKKNVDQIPSCLMFKTPPIEVRLKDTNVQIQWVSFVSWWFFVVSSGFHTVREPLRSSLKDDN